MISQQTLNRIEQVLTQYIKELYTHKSLYQIVFDSSRINASSIRIEPIQLMYKPDNTPSKFVELLSRDNLTGDELLFCIRVICNYINILNISERVSTNFKLKLNILDNKIHFIII